VTERRDFDAVARTWDDSPVRVELAKAVAEAIRREVPLAAGWTAMDYGCGTGLVTLLLSPHLGAVLAVDSSQGMLDVLAEKLTAAGIANVETRKLDLTTEEAPVASYELIFSAMALHHIPEPAALLGQFADLLRPGGYLAIADLDAEDGSFHPDPTGIHHHGFSREQRQTLFAGAGLTDIRTVLAHTVTRPDATGQSRDYPVLLTVGVKP
jgi:tRNA (cmo5U34)-methyltransferase